MSASEKKDPYLFFMLLLSILSLLGLDSLIFFLRPNAGINSPPAGSGWK